VRSSRNYALAVILAILALPSLAQAKFMSCRLEYEVHTWSVLYKNVSGTGTITCDNGQRARVRLQLHGGGLTLGVSELSGVGRFSRGRDRDEALGGYGSLEGHAGVVRSIEGRVMTKGPVWLSLWGKGRGFDLGFAFGGFTIRRD